MSPIFSIPPFVYGLLTIGVTVILLFLGGLMLNASVRTSQARRQRRRSRSQSRR
jgi:hypothetical protein